jgi:hypothetical protein
MIQRDGRDLEVHRANPKSGPFQFLEYARSRGIEIQDLLLLK